MKLRVLYPVMASLIITLAVFWQLPLKGLVPFPGRLLVGRLFPWNEQVWEGYPLGVPYKEFFSADTVRQTYPWRQLAVSELTQGRLPWWNPYAFSGNPLLANIQSASLYPLNLLYFVAGFDFIWILQVLLQPVLAILFTYLLARSLKLSPLASLFAGLVFAFSGYMTIWLELNTVGHAGLWLPLVLYLINRSRSRPRGYLLLVIPLTASLLAGHLQTSLYLLALSFFYLVFHHRRYLPSQPLTSPHYLLPVLALALSLLLASFQLLPALELVGLSLRSGENSHIFGRFLLPPSHLVTFLAPNFFGNPARGNYWGQDYGEFMAYFGLIPFLLYLVQFFVPKKSFPQKFFLSVTVAAFFLLLKNPLAYLLLYLNLPLLSSSAPVRILFLFQFSAGLLAAFSLDSIRQQPDILKRALLPLTGILALVLGYALVQWLGSSDPVTVAQFKVTLRNLAIPSLILAAALGLYWLTRKKFLPAPAFPAALCALTLFELSYFANGYLPFTEPKFIFPPSPPFAYLQEHAGLDRFFSDYTAAVTSNVWLPYRLHAPEGYDPLYLGRYGTLIHAASTQGQATGSAPRSDADLPQNRDDLYRRRLQDLLGVRYLIHQIEPTAEGFSPDYGRFPPDRYQLLWQQDRYQIYQNLRALPRAFLVPAYRVIHSDQEILDRIFDPSWDFTQTVILETQPQSHSQPPQPVPAAPVLWTRLSPAPLPAYTNAAGDQVRLISYTPTRLEFNLTAASAQFLFLSDNYYPGWQARLDGAPVPIYRANFTFRAVAVPPGDHRLEMEYRPKFSPRLPGL